MTKIFTNKKYLLYLFIIKNIIAISYMYVTNNFIDFNELKQNLSEQNFVISYISYTAILIIRDLTLLPGTGFLLIGIYLFKTIEVFFAIQIAIICYCLIIYNFSHKLNFNVPKKILKYKEKLKNKQIIVIFLLCFIPGISINILIYFLSISGIRLRNILIGIIAGTSITSIIYIAIIKNTIELF